MKKIVQLVALTLTLAGAVIAQFEPIDTNLPDIITYTGNQTSDGKFVAGMNQTMANSFVMNGYNRTYSSLLLTVSFDYSGEADFENGNSIVGGTWNMAVYANGSYVGSIFGDVVNGQISWSVLQGRGAKALTVEGAKTTEAYLKVNGGTGEFEGFTARYDAYLRSETNLTTGETDSTLKDFAF
jgi:hypothetical protein